MRNELTSIRPQPLPSTDSNTKADDSVDAIATEIDGLIKLVDEATAETALPSGRELFELSAKKLLALRVERVDARLAAYRSVVVAMPGIASALKTLANHVSDTCRECLKSELLETEIEVRAGLVMAGAPDEAAKFIVPGDKRSPEMQRVDAQVRHSPKMRELVARSTDLDARILLLRNQAAKCASVADFAEAEFKTLALSILK